MAKIKFASVIAVIGHVLTLSVTYNQQKMNHVFFKSKTPDDPSSKETIYSFLDANNIPFDRSIFEFLFSHELSVVLPDYLIPENDKTTSDANYNKVLHMLKESGKNLLIERYIRNGINYRLHIGCCKQGKIFQLGYFEKPDYILLQIKNLLKVAQKRVLEPWENFIFIGSIINPYGGIYINVNADDYGAIYFYDNHPDRALEEEYYRFPYDFLTFVKNLSLYIMAYKPDGSETQYLNIGTADEIAALVSGAI